ncbi:MAG: YggT family protein [Dehalococcoidia bacterium]|nr:YggT family protein [Dehalococcoidia bacterium]MCK5653799.1 YggT family protein [Dehalococcoidia bacterium]
MDVFLNFIAILCQVLAVIIFVRAILSWFAISPYSPIVVFLDRITEPILAPLRRIIPRLGMVDITPMVAIIILLLIARLIFLI